MMGTLAEVTAVSTETMFYLSKRSKEYSAWANGGIEAAGRLRALGSHARVVFLTANTDPDFVEAARSVGAVGYVVKKSLAPDLTIAIRAAIEGNSFTSPAMQD
jgi:DNA-binding NarL/FixJ family response regulator